MKQDKTRASLMAIVSAYMFYLAYQLFQGRDEADGAMSPAARIAFIVLFVAAGVAVGVYAWNIWKQSKKPKEEEPPPRDDQDDTMK